MSERRPFFTTCRVICVVVGNLAVLACAGTARRSTDPSGEILRESAREILPVYESTDSTAGTPSIPSLSIESLDETNLEAAAASVNEAASESPLSGFSFDMTAIAGHRSETQIRARHRHGFSAGLRAGDAWGTGFVRYDGGGLLRALHVGRMVVRSGERLSLGRGFGAYGAPGSGTVRDGFAVSPSLSKWSGIDGAALEIGRGGWRVHSLALADPGTRPGTVWHSVIRDFARGSIGIETAWTLGSASATAENAHETPGAENTGASPSRPQWRVVSGHGSMRGDGFDGSVELTRNGAEWFFAGRVVRGGRKDRWSLFVFKAPYDVPPAGPQAGPPVKIEHGVTFGASRRMGGVKTSAWFCGGRVAGRRECDTYRRVIVDVESGATGDVEWMLRVYGRERCEGSFPTSEVVREIDRELRRDLTLRGAISVRSGAGVRAAARVDYTPGSDGIEPGTVVAVATDVCVSRMDARITLTGYSLGAGRRGWASRPGIGAFEWFRTLSGRGSDLSMRLRLRVTATCGLVVFYGSSWRGDRRWYAGAEWRR